MLVFYNITQKGMLNIKNLPVLYCSCENDFMRKLFASLYQNMWYIKPDRGL